MSKTIARRQGLEVLTHVAEFVGRYLQGAGAAPAAARASGQACADELADLYGGNMFYLPRDTARRAEETRRQIVAKFTGRNQPELATEFGVSVQTIYKILKADRIARGQDAT